jgi:hypothetical protein
MRALALLRLDERPSLRAALRLAAVFVLSWGVIASFHADMLLGPQRLTMDFASYYYAAKVSQQDRNFYEVKRLERSRKKHKGIDRVFPYIYPPLLAQWLQPLATQTPSRAARFWNHLLVFAAALVVVTIVYTRRRRNWVTATVLAVFGGMLFTLIDNVRGVGQITLVLALLVALAFVAAQRSQESRWSGCRVNRTQGSPA